MSWVEPYEFREPLIDLRDLTESSEALTEELLREVAPGHPLHGGALRVIARALPNDDVIVLVDDEVAIVHLTWTRRKSERPPLPETTFIGSAEDFESYVESQYVDWEP
jgi:hypothetical protein